MTIRNETGGLTGFSFRLRGQYVVTGAFVDDTTPVVVTTDCTTTRVVTPDRVYGIAEEFTLAIEYTGDVGAEGGRVNRRGHAGFSAGRHSDRRDPS